MEDETTEPETTDPEEIVLTEEDENLSLTEKVGAVLFTAAAVVGTITVGKKAINLGRGKFAAWKESRKETPSPESEPEKPEPEED